MPHSKSKKLKLLEDTINYYSEDVSRRNKNEYGNCQYFPANSNTQGCAIGRLITPELQVKLDNEFGVFDNEALKLLPNEIKQYGLELLVELQQLHDTNSYWDENGLTIEGLNCVDKIKTEVIK